ncbi:unnamed protein product [Prorocentrum cordatum]|uniref:Uncharacterized protein n=1 Tax=Prorocentrum cordatum TaxID=2364126 RepID=A0ABN9U7L9_9DINO|nr:unnamed protein product [Polarella glacialis]
MALQGAAAEASSGLQGPAPGWQAGAPAGLYAALPADVAVARELLPIDVAAPPASTEPLGSDCGCRSVRSRARRRAAVDDRAREPQTAVNLLWNCGEAQASHRLSLAPSCVVQHLRSGWERLGAPDAGTAAACDELRGSRLGRGDPVKSAPSQRELVSLPAGGALAHGDQRLGGAASSF